MKRRRWPLDDRIAPIHPFNPEGVPDDEDPEDVATREERLAEETDMPEIKPEPCPDDLPPCPDDTTARLTNDPRALIIERNGEEVWRCWPHRGDWWSVYLGEEAPRLHVDLADALDWIRDDLGHRLPENAEDLELAESMLNLSELQRAADSGWCFTCGDTTERGHYDADCLQNGVAS